MAGAEVLGVLMTKNQGELYFSSVTNSYNIKLARKVPDIDVIISGHSHEKLDKPIKEGKTIIAGCGDRRAHV